jgi:hypothetical protein
MPAWAWLLLALAAVVVVAAAIAASVNMRKRRTRTRFLRRTFRAEYQQSVKAHDSKDEAERDLIRRLERRQALSITPLDQHQRQHYLRLWHEAQTQFVDAPEAAVAAADGLVIAVLRDCGFPVEDFDQRANDISVDYPDIVDNYRSAHTIAANAITDTVTTHELQQALQHYDSVFKHLLNATIDDRADGASVPPSGDTRSDRPGAPTDTGDAIV